jgi:hypothetical protein
LNRGGLSAAGVNENKYLPTKKGNRCPVQGSEESQRLYGHGEQGFVDLEQKWFDKKNPKWLKSSEIQRNRYKKRRKCSWRNRIK